MLTASGGRANKLQIRIEVVRAFADNEGESSRLRIGMQAQQGMR